MTLNNVCLLTVFIYLGVAIAQALHILALVYCAPWRYKGGTLLSVMGHGWVLYKLIETPQGQNLDWILLLSFTLWVLNILLFLVSFRAKVESLSILTYPFAALSIGLAFTMSGSHVVATQGHPTILIHVFISLFAVSFLLLATFQALLTGLQNTLLKHGYTAPILHLLPPLQTMETLLFTIIWVGMILLSGSLLSGFFFHSAFSDASLFSKTLLALCAWFAVSILLIGRYCFGWRATTAVQWTLSGSLLAFLSYFGTKALLL